MLRHYSASNSIQFYDGIFLLTSEASRLLNFYLARNIVNIEISQRGPMGREGRSSGPLIGNLSLKFQLFLLTKILGW